MTIKSNAIAGSNTSQGGWPCGGGSGGGGGGEGGGRREAASVEEVWLEVEGVLLRNPACASESIVVLICRPAWHQAGSSNHCHPSSPHPTILLRQHCASRRCIIPPCDENCFHLLLLSAASGCLIVVVRAFSFIVQNHQPAWYPFFVIAYRARALRIITSTHIRRGGRYAPHTTICVRSARSQPCDCLVNLE